MYVEYEKLLPDVVQVLINEGVEEQSFNKNRAIYAIQQAYREFVKDTHVLRRVICIPLQSCVSEYHLFKYDGHVISKIYSICCEQECDRWQTYDLEKICSPHRDTLNSGSPTNRSHYGGSDYRDNTYTYNDGFINICPAPSCDGLSLEACVSVFPEASSCLMDERVYELYREYLVHGAVARMLPQQQARAFREYFTIGKDEAESDASAQWARRTSNSRRQGWHRR